MTVVSEPRLADLQWRVDAGTSGAATSEILARTLATLAERSAAAAAGNQAATTMCVALVGFGRAGLRTASRMLTAGASVTWVRPEVAAVRRGAEGRGHRGSSTDGEPGEDAPLVEQSWVAYPDHGPLFRLGDDTQALAWADVILVGTDRPYDPPARRLAALGPACSLVVREATRGQTIVVTDSCYVGCTRDLLTKPLAERGLIDGADVNVELCPEWQALRKPVEAETVARIARETDAVALPVFVADGAPDAWPFPDRRRADSPLRGEVPAADTDDCTESSSIPIPLIRPGKDVASSRRDPASTRTGRSTRPESPATPREAAAESLERAFLGAPRDRRLERAAKRALDFVAAAAALVLLSPLLLGIALAILLDDGRPILFTQTRIGEHGRAFRFRKFRTMVDGAEQRLGDVLPLNQIHGPGFQLEHDPRLTKLGAFLRRSSLDELPQLWNVLVGEMSLVGPRPAPLCEVAEYLPWHRRRLYVKPGITGLAQITARRYREFDQKAYLDAAYIDEWSLALDVRILLRTIPAVLGMTGQ